MQYDINTALQSALAETKLTLADVVDKLHVLLYFDGGARNGQAGWGVHGYIYLDEETKSNSKAPKGSPGKCGYISSTNKKDDNYKVTVLLYVDMYGNLGQGTNNMGELTACTKALELVNSFDFVSFKLLGDSQYVISNLVDNYRQWVANDYKTSSGKPVANVELWKKLDAVYQQVKHKGELQWVKGHSGDIGNDYADTLATSGCYCYGDGGLSIRSPKQRYEPDSEMSVLLGENRIMFGDKPSVLPIYWQYSMGAMAPGKEADKRSVLGKRIADTTLSVVWLKDKDPVIEDMFQRCREHFKFKGIMVGRLDVISRQLYYHNLQLGLAEFKSDDGLLISAEDVTVFAELTQPRLAFRKVALFEDYTNLLVNHVQNHLSGSEYTTIDVTSMVYDISEDKKGKPVYSCRATSDEAVISCPVEVDGIATVVKLTIAVDLPSIVVLNRIGKLTPKVQLLLRKATDHNDVYNYCIIIEANGEYGLWVGAYSNIHIIKRGTI